MEVYYSKIPYISYIKSHLSFVPTLGMIQSHCCHPLCAHYPCSTAAANGRRGRHIHDYAFLIISVKYRFTVVYGDTFHYHTNSNAKIANSGNGGCFYPFSGACQKVSPEITITQEVAEMIFFCTQKYGT